ncbi:MAG: TIGR01212 family radical SAM protein [Lachnospiraceae bacterium]|nr:TIGR01212 family radical SAM protein [Lachnospiraceae bacterium]
MKIRTISEELKEKYGEKVYRLALSSGCTCPNRDGTLGYGGCTFCSGSGSGEFASKPAPIDVQIEEAKKLIRKKTDARKFIAYFQSYSNTYGDIDHLREIYTEAVNREDIVRLALGTRPDCLSPKVMNLLKELNEIKPVWIELGLQTIHEKTAEMIRRGYPLSVFEDAYSRLKDAGLDVIVHVILGLPGETEQDMLETVGYLSRLDPVLDGIKIHMLQILKGTQMAEEYMKDPFPLMKLDEYCDLVIRCLKLLDPETVIHRMTGDGPKSLLTDPLWCADKKRVINTLYKRIADA